MSQASYYLDNKPYQETEQNSEKTHYLLTGYFDAFFMGGASILFFFASIILLKQHDHPYFAKLIFLLGFLVNFPHFLLSYQLLYIDFRQLIFSRFAFFWAGIIVPMLLISLLFLSSYFNPAASLGYFVNALYFLVGWHYIKQIFGTIIVTNALKNVLYNKIERWCLQANLYMLWGISWLWTNTDGSLQIYEGIIYSGFQFPRRYVLYCFVAIIITLIFVLITHLRKHIKEKNKPSLTALIAFIAAYFWFIPLFYNPIFFPCIAFFHSLQYLPFVYAVRRNKIKSELVKINPEKRSKTYFVHHYGYLLSSMVLGAILFYFLPKYLDQMKLFDFDLFGPTVVMFYFAIFLNIHHYFIDNVIWKKNNAQMHKYLFSK
ncbi:MAG: hypothetical protein ACYCQI_15080 [Gammaproteobacteria bacterium]